MDNTIDILRTGDFWIDVGICYIWKQFLSRGSKIRIDEAEKRIISEILIDNNKDDPELIAMLYPSKITIEYSDEKVLSEELTDILETTKPQYLGISKSGREKWDRQGLFFSAITQRRLFFEPPRLGIRSKIYTSKCAFCESERFPIKQCGATNQPLISNPGKFSSFYSNFRGDIKICEMCNFASKFSPLCIFYGVSKKLLTAIVFESNDLMDLDSVLKEFSEISIGSDGYRNFRSTLGFTTYPLETFLDFLFSIIQSIERKKDMEGINLMIKGLISKVHIIQGTLGRVLSLDKYYVIPNLPRVLDFISMCRWLSSNQKVHNSMLETAKWLVVKREKDTDTTVREEFARRIIYNRDSTDLIEQFLMSYVEDERLNQYVSINLDKFIKMYSLNILYLDTNQLNLAKLLGNIVGNLAAKHEKSLLYNLRSIGNLESLLEFFHRLLVRYPDEIKQFELKDKPSTNDFDKLLKALDNTNWRTYKSLIGIYSALKFSGGINEINVKNPINNVINQ